MIVTNHKSSSFQNDAKEPIYKDRLKMKMLIRSVNDVKLYSETIVHTVGLYAEDGSKHDGKNNEKIIGVK